RPRTYQLCAFAAALIPVLPQELEAGAERADFAPQRPVLAEAVVDGRAEVGSRVRIVLGAGFAVAVDALDPDGVADPIGSHVAGPLISSLARPELDRHLTQHRALEQLVQLAGAQTQAGAGGLVLAVARFRRIIGGATAEQERHQLGLRPWRRAFQSHFGIFEPAAHAHVDRGAVRALPASQKIDAGVTGFAGVENDPAGFDGESLASHQQ